MKGCAQGPVFLTLLFLSSFTIWGCSSHLVDQLRAYETAHNNHDIDQILTLVTDDIQFNLVGMPVKEGKGQMRAIEEWDAAVNGHLTFTNLRVRGNTVTCQVVEQNDLFKLYGIDEVHYQSVTFVFHDGLIGEIRARMSDESYAAINEAMQSFLQWASQERSQALAVLMPQGEPIYSVDNASLWLALVGEWRERGQPK